MKLIFKFSILLFTTILLTTSCRKDLDESTVIDINIPGPEIITLIHGDLDVYITDIDGNSLEDVDVFVYDEKVTTDNFGVAQFRNIPLDANGTFVRALSPGFFFGSDKFFPNGTSNSIVIRLLPLNNGKEITPTSATQVEIEGGGNVKFKANSFVDKDGEDYNDVVTVYAKRINPEDALSHEVMPGNLLGLDDRGNTVVLESFSMVAVELRDKDGNELLLKDGFPATLTFAVDENLQGVAPQFIPTWSFDELGGNWIEEGSAELIDGNYVAEVSHFSFWNCDAPFPLVNVTGSVVDPDGNPQVGFYVLVKVNGMCGAGYTNGDGVFSGKMPKNQQLTFCVFAPGCDEPVFSTTLGPFTENTVLDPFVIETSTANYSGVVLCEGVPLANAPIYLVFNNITEKYFSDANGQFSIDVQEINCVSFPEGELFAVNPDTGVQSEIIEVSDEDLADIEFEVCVGCDISPDIIVDQSDPCGGFAVLTLDLGNPPTTYTFEWSNGSTSNTITVEESGVYCVTITEPITECSITVCEEVEIAQPLQVALEAFDITCFESGAVFATGFNGTSPYTYDWSGPDFFEIGDGQIEVFSPGEYMVTVTDVNGCTAIATAFVQEQNSTQDLPIGFNDFDIPILCGGDSILLFIDCPWCPIDTSSVQWFLPDGSTFTGGSLIATEPGYYEVFLDEGNCAYLGGIDVEGSESTYTLVETSCEVNSYDLIFEINTNGISSEYALNLEFSDLITDFPNNFSGEHEYVNAIGCNVLLEYDLPYATGIVIEETTEPTCGTCTDGSVIINYDAFDCSCQLGNAIVIADGDPTKEFDQTELGYGEYQLLVYDQFGCLIFVEDFTI